MKQAKLEKMTTDQLVTRFAEIGIAQDQAELMGEIGKFNRLYRQMDATEKELRRRGREDVRHYFFVFDHPNMQVRLNAAKRTLALRLMRLDACSKLSPIRNGSHKPWMPECHSEISIEECSSQIDGGIPVLRWVRKRRWMQAG